MKLKTLKEIELRDEIHKTHDCKKCEGFNNGTDELEENIQNKLKQEAIKCIKSIGNCGNIGGMYGEGICGVNKFSCTECNYKKVYLIPWIKHFFNITEKDLNNSNYL